MGNMLTICCGVCSILNTLYKARGYDGEDNFLKFQRASCFTSIFHLPGYIVFIPIYDCILVPTIRAFTRRPSGITVLQKIGIGLLSSTLCMIVAALVETKRLEIVKEHDLVDMPSATIPMSVSWLVPQYVLLGIADVLFAIGLQELFYSQVPYEIRSVGVAMFISTFGAGSFLSTFLVSVIDKATSSGSGQDSSWFSDHLNQAHLDYFYWLLVGVSAMGFTVFLYFARSFIYN